MIVFHPARVERQNRVQEQALMLLLDQSKQPIPLPISEGHLLMGFSNALARLDIRIGHGKDEVSPEDCVKALREGMRTMLPDAMKDEREQALEAALKQDGPPAARSMREEQLKLATRLGLPTS